MIVLKAQSEEDGMNGETGKIIIPKIFTKPVRSESVTVWVSKDVSESLDRLSNETGISKQRITDLLLKKAMESVEIVDCDIDQV